eukprot:6604535-Pyramimonas_sp.AAC.1
MAPTCSATGPRRLSTAAFLDPPRPGALFNRSAPSRRCSTAAADSAPASRSLNGNPSALAMSAPRATHSAIGDVACDIYSKCDKEYLRATTKTTLGIPTA